MLSDCNRRLQFSISTWMLLFLCIQTNAEPASSKLYFADGTTVDTNITIDNEHYKTNLANVDSVSIANSIANKERRLIYGGTNAQNGMYPFNVHILNCCGGTLIRHDMVLTTANCLTNCRDFSTVYIGGNKNDTGTQHFVKKAFIHPKYDAITVANDIGILQLNCSSKTKGIKLNFDPKKPVPGSIVWSIGFGQLSDLSFPVDLQEVRLQTYSNVDCQNKWRIIPNIVFNGAKMTCAGRDIDGFGTCGGDLGGPLIIAKNINPNTMIQVGIASFGTFCGSKNFPIVYTRVSKYKQFIQNIIKKHGKKKLKFC
jgi:secreted trypsin-like serine protease